MCTKEEGDHIPPIENFFWKLDDQSAITSVLPFKVESAYLHKKWSSEKTDLFIIGEEIYFSKTLIMHVCLIISRKQSVARLPEFNSKMFQKKRKKLQFDFSVFLIPTLHPTFYLINFQLFSHKYYLSDEWWRFCVL